MSATYWNYKGFYTFPYNYKGPQEFWSWFHKWKYFYLEYELQRPNLKYIKIQFNAPVFDKITKDSAAKFVDKLSAIGGTMGLLTGFSIISGVEILYFACKVALGYIDIMREKTIKNK